MKAIVSETARKLLQTAEGRKSLREAALRRDGTPFKVGEEHFRLTTVPRDLESHS